MTSLLRRRRATFLVGTCLACLAFGLVAVPAAADKITHPTAVFSGLDKITGRIISFEVTTDETVQFGSLQITERACFTRPATEAPQTDTFVEVDEVDAKNNYKRIFSGWMFASSPGLHGIEHPIYDIWLTDCKGGTEVIASPPETVEAEPPAPENAKPVPKQGTQRAKRNVDDNSLSGDPAAVSAGSTARGAPIEVGPPPGLAPHRAPTQRFFPVTPAPGGGIDPAGRGGGGF